ncbi:MAG: ABC transporter ATP-binding protein [Candidatus Thiodiazotropha sp. (ex Ctena orbiculata)]|nr:ABC transporter ATP-binding protein [Candidatus Thiodiazotropha taylori]MBT3033791.1 ABC transporter ATP-binding protein [Candidatus Thiodiazotropha taylori]MBV2135542.1 ABC transporter ATP-binding protein [Candidatus Thiodiazotropha taylori]
MATIEFDNVCKSFGDGINAIHELNLKVDDGELMVLVGPSGCGKSTLLRMTAGLEEVSSGEIRIDDRVVNHTPPQQRNVAMVFQNYALYPHMTVRGNLEFPLRMQKQPANRIEASVKRIAEMLDLSPLLDRKPKALSGGQRQRVAMGRAIIREADIFLMDEPLSNLDARLRVEIRGEIAQLQRELAITTLYVTHDQAEAMTLGQRVAIIDQGLLQQVGSPQEIYERPNNSFVAGFIGSPGMNLIQASLSSERGEIGLRLGSKRLPLPQPVLASYPGLASYREERLLVGIRPHAIHLAHADSTQHLAARVCAVEAMGHETILHLDTELIMHANPKTAADKARENQPHLLVQLNGHHNFRVGDQLRIELGIGKLCFFDADGRAIG